jgi:hypothetical protein
MREFPRKSSGIDPEKGTFPKENSRQGIAII